MLVTGGLRKESQYFIWALFPMAEDSFFGGCQAGKIIFGKRKAYLTIS